MWIRHWLWHHPRAEHWKRLWCWEGLGAGGKGDDRGWDGWMASPTRRTWVWVNSRSWWWTGRPGVLWFMGSQTIGHDWTTELNWTERVCQKHQISGQIPDLLNQNMSWKTDLFCGYLQAFEKNCPAEHSTHSLIQSGLIKGLFCERECSSKAKALISCSLEPGEETKTDKWISIYAITNDKYCGENGYGGERMDMVVRERKMAAFRLNPKPWDRTKKRVLGKREAARANPREGWARGGKMPKT